MKGYSISTSKFLLDAEKIQRLLKNCFWSENVPVEYVKRFIKHSLCFGVYQKNPHELVGFGRVITDYTTFAYIGDIVIDPRHRGKGLGTALVSRIMHHPELRGLKTWSLRTTEEAKAIYESNGFKPAEETHTILEIEDLQIYNRTNFVNLHMEREPHQSTHGMTLRSHRVLGQ